MAHGDECTCLVVEDRWGGIVRAVRPLIAAQIHEAVREVVSEAFKGITVRYHAHVS